MKHKRSNSPPCNNFDRHDGRVNRLVLNADQVTCCYGKHCSLVGNGIGAMRGEANGKDKNLQIHHTCQPILICLSQESKAHCLQRYPCNVLGGERSFFEGFTYHVNCISSSIEKQTIWEYEPCNSAVKLNLVSMFCFLQSNWLSIHIIIYHTNNLILSKMDVVEVI